MEVYAESSAVLAWLLGEEQGKEARRCLTEADLVVSSDLTVLECERALIRASTLGEVPEAKIAALRSQLTAAANRWNLLNLTTDVIDRARQPFPGDPIRTLDALHVASALAARSELPEIGILTLDDRIRRVCRALGFEVLPRF